MFESVEHDFLISLSVAIVAGTFMTILARKVQVSAIILLLGMGILLGPEGVGVVKPESLEGVLGAIVSLSVGLILFEGGLTLDLKGYEHGSRVIKRLLTVGVLITWVGTAMCVWWLTGKSLSFSFLAGSLVIVTGPTVIVPLLRRIRAKEQVHHVLHWEGVLIDPIGVFLAILCFEWVVVGEQGQAVTDFILRVVLGSGIGGVGGILIYMVLERGRLDESHLNIFTLGAAVAVFTLTEWLIHEGGVLAVTVAGFIVGWKHPSSIKEIKKFKGELTDLLIGVLFILLSARLELEDVKPFGWVGLMLVVMVMVVVRPLNILVSTWGSGLGWREKLFLSWVAPRGIVAASMASLFAIALAEQGDKENAVFLEMFTYSVIVLTVVLQGFSAPVVVKWLGLQRERPTGWLIVGAHALGRSMGAFIQSMAKRDVLLVDSNQRSIREARRAGLTAVHANALDLELADHEVAFQKVGRVLALTDNAELNELICQRWGDRVGKDVVYRWSPLRADRQKPRGDYGQVFCPQLAMPSVIATELLHGESYLKRVTKREGERDGGDKEVEDGQMLMVFHDEEEGRRLQPVVHGESQELAEGDTVLMLKRLGGYLWRAMENGKVVDEKAESMMVLYRKLVEGLIEQYPNLSAKKTLEDLEDREKSLPTYLGNGVAVPHVYSNSISRRICVLARVREGLEVEDQNERLHLVFLLLSPAGDPDGHLAALAEIARLCVDEENRNYLLAAEDTGAMKAFIRSKVAG